MVRAADPSRGGRLDGNQPRANLCRRDPEAAAVLGPLDRSAQSRGLAQAPRQQRLCHRPPQTQVFRDLCEASRPLLPEAPGPVKAALSGRRGGGSPVSPPCPPGAHGAWHSGARAGCPQHLFCGRGFTELPAVRPDFSGRRGLLASQRSLKTCVWGGR